MRYFDDYEQHYKNDKVRLCLRRTTDEVMSSWEISNFLSNFSSYYYRIELLDSIRMALEYGINPRNIIIFDESFKLNRKYTKLNQIKLIDDLNYLYYIGKPISLFPNDNIKYVYLLFKYFRLLNEFFYQIRVRRLPSNTLSDYYELFNTQGIKTSFEELFGIASNIVSKSKKKHREKLNRIQADCYNELNNYMGDSIRIKSVFEQLGDGTSIAEISSDYDDILTEYFDRFFDSLIRIPRPVVCVFIEDEEVIEILSRAHINVNERNSSFLDVEEISHNSPLKALIQGGASIYSTIKDEQRKNEIHELEKRKMELEIANLETEAEILALEKVNKQLEIRYKFIEMNRLREDSIKNIDNSYVRSKMLEAYSKVQDNNKRLLNTNQIIVDYENTTV